LTLETNDDIYQQFAINEILANIINFELAPSIIRNLIYRSIIYEFQNECHPKLYKRYIMVMNWSINIMFIIIHMCWFRLLWVLFVNQLDDEYSYQNNIVNPISNNAQNNNNVFVSNQQSNYASLSRSIASGKQYNGGPSDIFVTMSQFNFMEIITAVLFFILLINIFLFYYISRRIDAFGDLLEKLKITKLLEFINAKDIQYRQQRQNRLQERLMMENDDVFFIYNPALTANNDAFDTLQWQQQYQDNNNNINTIEDSASEEDVDTNDQTSSDDNVDDDNIDGNSVDDNEINKEEHNILENKIESLYFHRQHFLVYSVISLVKTLILTLYVGCLLCYYLIPNTHYWYLWPTLFYIFATYIIISTIFSLIKKLPCCSGINNYLLSNNNYTSNNNTARRENTNFDETLIIDGISQNEWVVASVNIICVTSLLTLMCDVLAQYKENHAAFVQLRINYLLYLAIIEIFWIASQMFMLHKRYYGTIFYVLLLIPTVLLCAAAIYSLYEYFILGVIHLFLSVIISCGEFQLISNSRHNDHSTYDFSDWTILGILAVLTKLFSFRMPH